MCHFSPFPLHIPDLYSNKKGFSGTQKLSKYAKPIIVFFIGL